MAYTIMHHCTSCDQETEHDTHNSNSVANGHIFWYCTVCGEQYIEED